MDRVGRVVGLGASALLLICSFVLPSVAGTTTVSMDLVLSPTSALIMQEVECQVTVQDTGGGGMPTGDVSFSDGGKNGAFPFGDSAPLDGSGKCSVVYVPGAGDEGTTTITASYPGSAEHEAKSADQDLAVGLRPTVTSIDCTPTATGCDCMVTTEEDAGNEGVETTPIGRLLDVADASTLINPFTGGPSPVSVTNDGIYFMVTAKYGPTDDIHSESIGTVEVKRDDPAFLPGGGECASDINVQAIIFGLKSAVQGSTLATLIIDANLAALTAASGLPWINAAKVTLMFVKLGLNTYKFAATLDLDQDKLPSFVEIACGLNDLSNDIDGDGLTDNKEIDKAKGFFSPDPGPEPWKCACPNPTLADTDDDGLSDGKELSTYFTDPCNPDTDGDGIKDGDEVDTWASADVRDHADPLTKDTDGDGISDAIEMPLGCLGTPDARDGFVNSFDSDGDGLNDFLDAYADLPAEPSAVFPGALYIVMVPGSGDNLELIDDDLPSIADEDSDGDGLYDGFEHTRKMDFLDWDGDDDGRCDGHEVLGLGPIPTDPFDDDSDDDGILDSAELWGSNPTNPVMADTDGDGLCDGGVNTPSGTGTNLSCSCTVGAASGIDDHPNPNGLGEDDNGNGSWDVGETNPNQHDTDGDGIGDGIEKLGFSTSRQSMIPATDMLGRAVSVTYPACGCLDPLVEDTDHDGLSDGYEDADGDGNFDFLPSDFDYTDPLPGPTMPDPKETNPCDADTDDDGLNDYDERFQPNPAAFYQFNRTNPLDHDTDNDWLLDGEEVGWTCVDPGFDLDPDRDGVDDYFVKTVIGDVLDPTNRDSDSDDIIDGLDPNPCYGDMMPIIVLSEGIAVDSDGDGFSDSDELEAGTDPEDAASFPAAFTADLDEVKGENDRLWLVDYLDRDGVADLVVIDIGSDGLIDKRIQTTTTGAVELGDFDGDGAEDDARYVIVFAFPDSRNHLRATLVIDDYDSDLEIDEIDVEVR